MEHRKKISVNFTKQVQNVLLVCIMMVMKLTYMWIKQRFMVCDNLPWYVFCLGSVSKDFSKDEMSEISLNSIV